ncbi:hypothetical protein PISMIDRAFT_393088 [Pisolithus microcarpus 441]|uniref:Unplaced genomic scaffold scaffold_3, whole genome shotgun sequence n=1 Tax=Pisolithus microcarpus 441 TaxID=765257 RepID=A0A0D0A761_9AGAM|nr:hypothetical protein PISMIDRAFT_393088 [Pisolithus microcarpus 441]
MLVSLLAKAQLTSYFHAQRTSLPRTEPVNVHDRYSIVNTPRMTNSPERLEWIFPSQTYEVPSRHGMVSWQQYCLAKGTGSRTIPAVSAST